MNRRRFGALHLGVCALLVLLALQALWHGWAFPAPPRDFRATLALSMLPLAVSLWISLYNLRRGVLIGGMVGLFYFCHGISTAWSDAGARWLALVEIALTLIVIGVLGWDARHYRRPPKQGLSAP